MRPSIIVGSIVVAFVGFGIYILFSTGVLTLTLGQEGQEEIIDILETKKNCYDNECMKTFQDFYEAAESLRSVEIDSKNLQTFVESECLEQVGEDIRCEAQEYNLIVDSWEELLSETFSKNLTVKYKDDTYVPLVMNHYGTFNLLHTDRAPDAFYESTELVFVSAEETRIEFTARSIYVDYVDCEPMYPLGTTYEVYPARYYLNDECNYYKENPFVLIKEGNKWVVDQFTLPY